MFPQKLKSKREENPKMFRDWGFVLKNKFTFLPTKEVLDVIEASFVF